MEKNQIDWEILRLDSIVYQLLNRQLNQLSDFHLAWTTTGRGKFVLKKTYKGMEAPFELPTYARWDEDHFFRAFKDCVYKPGCNIEKEGNYLQSKMALAKLTCEKNYVSLDSKAGVVVVTGLHDGKQYTVKRKPDGSLHCSCISTGFCHHRMAMLYSLNLPIPEDTYTYNLSVLTKKSRPYKGRTGKKRPNANDVMLDFTPSADSDAAMYRDRLDLMELGTEDDD